MGEKREDDPARAPMSAAVLAGGRSTRMGRDKALMPLVAGGPPMLAIVLDRLRRVADDITIVSDPRPGYDRFGATVAPDEWPGTGALGGIATALRHAAHPHCLVVACDMPFLSPVLLRYMVDQPRDYDVLAARFPGESRQGGGMVVQTLHAIYGRRCLHPIETQLATGNRQVVGFFPSVAVRFLEEDVVRGMDSDLASFFNANTPEAAAEARTIAGRRSDDPAGFPPRSS